MEGVPRRNASQFTFKIGNGLSIKREDLQNYNPFKGVTDPKARTTSSGDTHQCQQQSVKKDQNNLSMIAGDRGEAHIDQLRTSPVFSVDEDNDIRKAMSLSMETYQQQNEECIPESIEVSKESEQNDLIYSEVIENIYSQQQIFPAEIKKGMSRQQIDQLIKYVQSHKTPESVQEQSYALALKGIEGSQAKSILIDNFDDYYSVEMLLGTGTKRQKFQRERLEQALKFSDNLKQEENKGKKYLLQQSFEMKQTSAEIKRREKNRLKRYKRCCELGFKPREKKKMLKKKLFEIQMVYMKTVSSEKTQQQTSKLQRQFLNPSHDGLSKAVVKLLAKRSEKMYRQSVRNKDKIDFVKKTYGHEDAKEQKSVVRLNNRVKHCTFDKDQPIKFKSLINSQENIQQYVKSLKNSRFYYAPLKKPRIPQYINEVVIEVREEYRYKHRQVALVPQYMKIKFSIGKNEQKSDSLSEDSKESAISGQTEFYRRDEQEKASQKIRAQLNLDEDYDYQDDDEWSEESGIEISDDDQKPDSVDGLPTAERVP